MLENGDDTLKFHFIGGLRLNQCPEPLKVPKEQYVPLEGEVFVGTSAFRKNLKIYGREFTAIITDNPNLRDAQLLGLNYNIAKCEKELSELQDNLRLRGEGKIVKGGKRTSASVANKIKKILSIEHMSKIIEYNINYSDNNISIDYSLNIDKYNNLVNNYLGKTILLTNRDCWSNEQIVATYMAKYHVEESFRQTNNMKYLSFYPQKHHTDRIILAHRFYCILAFTLSCLLQREMDELGYRMSLNAMLEAFSDAKLSLNIYSSNSSEKSRVVPVFSEMSPPIAAYIAKRDLKKYALR
ncbi:MAG: hypothetical protein LBS60_11805 [Deltaproteobacteria bacterium]|jgi:transposase|nr:hypothetical protein [Deltaproteobacteria bacterium]